MRFLEIIGLSVAAVVFLLSAATFTAWACTFAVGSWIILLLLVTYMFFICFKASNETKLSRVINKDLLPVCFGISLLLALFWFIGHLTLSNMLPLATIGYTIIWGAMSITGIVCVLLIVIAVLQLLVRLMDGMFSKKRLTKKEFKSCGTFIVSTLFGLAALLATMYYAIYPIGVYRLL